MFSLRNGILYEEEKPVIALGQSYYPSYHRQKVPVPPEGDRLGEMKKDLHNMRAAGFNIVRMAALGDIDWNEGDVKVDFPLVDAFCQECNENDLASMIRLQGYSMNLRNFDDATMLDANGEKMKFHWGWFVRNCLNHPGIYEDNVKGTIASAAHFKQHKSVVSFQIYNEPAYPTEGLFDYHPHSIARYRTWLVEKGYASAQEAAVLDAPRHRPLPGEDPTPWVRWRTFCTERLTWYLVDMGVKAREGYALPENLTCHMGCPVFPGSSIRGEDYFETAKGMDILGITHYTPCRGPSYHMACCVLDAAESAAATFQKHAWIIEYNARTNMPPQEWDRETYAAMGRGYKGILYYQWRADFPYPDSPEPEAFGMLFNNGRKAPCYEEGLRMTALINRLSSHFACAEKVRSGAAILYSNHANAYYDAVDNGGAAGVGQCHDRYILASQRLYSQLNAEGVVVDFARACDLQKNPLSVKTLILPFVEGLSEEELIQIEAFRAAGGHVYRYDDRQSSFTAWTPSDTPVAHGILLDQYDPKTFVAYENLLIPACVIGAPCVDARLLTGVLNGKPYGIVSLANYDPLEQPIEGTSLVVKGFATETAKAFAPDLPEEGVALEVTEGAIQLPSLSYGAYILLNA